MHGPHSLDGQAAWRASLACVDEHGVRIAEACHVAERLGCAPDAAAELVMAVAAGLRAGHAKRAAEDNDVIGADRDVR